MLSAFLLSEVPLQRHLPQLDASLLEHGCAALIHRVALTIHHLADAALHNFDCAPKTRTSV